MTPALIPFLLLHSSTPYADVYDLIRTAPHARAHRALIIVAAALALVVAAGDEGANRRPRGGG